MSSFYSHNVETESDGYSMDGQMNSPSFTSHQSFTMSPLTPTMNELLMFGQGPDTSPFASPPLAPMEVGSAPVSFPMLDLQNSLAQDAIYYNTSSHSFPGTQFQSSQASPRTANFGTIHEQENNQVWVDELFMRGGDSGLYMPTEPHHSVASSSTTEDVDLKHVPSGWAAASHPMARTGSAYSQNSVGSYNSNNSFDDFRVEDSMFGEYQHGGFQVSIVNDDRISSGQSGWSDNASASDSIDDAATPRAVPVPRNPGRKGKLTQEQRDHAAYIRKIGACALCRLRRARCDGGIPCSACKRYYRNSPEDLEQNPCRGDHLQELADLILNKDAFPKGPYQRFLGTNFSVERDNLKIHLNLGFAHSPFPCRIRLIRARENASGSNPFVHKHIDYPWPPAFGHSAKDVREDYVFPAILVDSDKTIATQIETLLESILADRTQFQYFPLWQSPLKVLRVFYKYYLTLPVGPCNPLKQAFQLLILLHVGGDLRLYKDDPMTMRINDKFFPGMPYEHILPCFIRAQLGPIFSTVAHGLMSDVLKQLERLSSLQDSAHFPMVIATFSVLFMALESLQYHCAKKAFHSHCDSPTQINDILPAERNLADFDGADILLRLYNSTNCHAQLKTLINLPASPQRPHGFARSQAGSSTSSSWSTGGCLRDHGVTEFLSSLGQALSAAGPYIASKTSMDSVVSSDDMSCFFDRLLCKMYSLAPNSNV